MWHRDGCARGRRGTPVGEPYPSDGKVTDKTRVVFNARKRETYEVGCDAAKFMAEGVPQLYSLDGQGVKYANQRTSGG